MNMGSRELNSGGGRLPVHQPAHSILEHPSLLSVSCSLETPLLGGQVWSPPLGGPRGTFTTFTGKFLPFSVAASSTVL